MNQIAKTIIYFICFTLSFYLLSGVDFSKFMLNRNDRGFKGQFLLILFSMALGYLCGQFIISIQITLL